MKKAKHILSWLLALAMLTSMLSACDVIINPNDGNNGNDSTTDGSADNGGNANGGNANGNDSNNNSDSIVTEYVKTEEIYSAKKAGEQGAANYQLKNSFRDDNCWYFVYYLGRVENVPLDLSRTNWEHFNGTIAMKVKTSYSKMTAEEVAQTIERSHTETDGWSNELKTKLEGSLSLSSTIERRVDVAAAIEGIGVGAGVSASNTITATLTAGLEETIGYRGELTNSLVLLDESKKSETLTETLEKEYTFDSGYNTPAGYYQLAHFAAVDVFGIVIYNPTTEKATVSSISNYSMISSQWAYSADSNWESNLSPEMLTLDVEGLTFTEPEKYVKNPEQELKPEQETTTVTVDFTEQYGEGENADVVYANPKLENYDAANFADGIFKAKGTYGGKKVTKYVFKGCYNTQNNDGDTSKYILSNFTIQIDAEHDIEIVLDHVSFRGAAGLPAIRLNPDKTQNITVTLTVNGESILYGADGQNAESAGESGDNGAAAIDFSASEGAELIIGGIAKLTVVGGNGGDGYNGKNGTKGSNGKDIGLGIATGDSRPGGKGTSGENGTNGGNGGASIKATLTTIRTQNVILIGGNGGAGGAGGNGGAGGKGGQNSWAGALGGCPGSGGDGGNGGDGGRAGNELLMSGDGIVADGGQATI